MAMHNTVMTNNTNVVPPSETHVEFLQALQNHCQFKYWGNGASENMTTYMTIYTLFKIQGTNRKF